MVASSLRAAAMLTAVTLAGCTSTGPAAPEPSTEPAPDITARVIQYRLDEGTREVDVQISNADTAALRISVEGLDWPGVVSPSRGNRARFEPGQTIDLPVTLGRFRCGGVDVSGKPIVTLRVRAAGRVERTVRVAAGGRGLLTRLRASDCQRRALARVVDIDYAPDWSYVRDPEPGVRATVVFTRRSPGAVSVVGMSGSVLLDFRPTQPAGRPLLVIPPRQPIARLPVLVTSSGRCDAHALGGSTQTFLLSAFVRNGDGPTQRVLLVPDASAQRQILTMISRSCER